jgi:16S rRNA (cytosine1402-N4)-methyltransferase
MSETVHIPVMLSESVDALRPKAGGIYIDGTLGGGSHTEELLRRSGPDGRVLSLDVDPEALQRAKTRLKSYGKRWMGVEGNFRDLAELARREGFTPCDGVLLDLGLSSDELEDPKRGISFRIDGPLDMRLGPYSNRDGITAATIVNGWREADLTKLLREIGEERYASRIASAIFKARKASSIERTTELADIVRAAVPAGYERGRIDPATRTFQALRIAVNDELEALSDVLTQARSILAPGGRISVISFHSLEDRIVKQSFKGADDLAIITKKPLVPSSQEVTQNPRSRSAKLRIAEKINHSETSDSDQKTKTKRYAKHVRHDHDQTA